MISTSAGRCNGQFFPFVGQEYLLIINCVLLMEYFRYTPCFRIQLPLGSFSEKFTFILKRKVDYDDAKLQKDTIIKCLGTIRETFPPDKNPFKIKKFLTTTKAKVSSNVHTV